MPQPSQPIVRLPDREIGPDRPVFIIAEAGVNHNGDLALARRLVDAAVEAGADAVKFQAFKAEEVVSVGAAKAEYQVATSGGGESQLDMVRKLELSAAAFRELQTYCTQRGILFLATPFDFGSVDLLAEMNVPLFKISSGEVTNLPFLEYVAGQGKPLILSTGMCFLGEVDEAVRLLQRAGVEELVLLHCTSNYPTRPEDVNLRAMQTLGAAFGLPVGYSDHTTGIAVSLAAAALGACVIEKHFTLDRTLPGPDHQASLEPAELTAMVRGIRTIEAALGDPIKQRVASEDGVAQVARRSLVASRDLAAGTVLTRDLIAIKRPGTGLQPALLAHLLGRKLRVDVAYDQLFELGFLE
ncbi:MAG: N-acetylneuraminate synthase [Chthoniobacter sp.]